MAEAKNKTKSNAKVEQEIKAMGLDPNDKVEIRIPKGREHDDPNLFVSVNGINYLLPKGKTSVVPRFIADEIQRSWEAQEMLDENKDELLEAAK